MSAAGFGVPNNSNGWAFLVDPDGNVSIGDEASDVLQITGSSYSAGSLSVAQAGGSLGDGYFFRAGDPAKAPSLYISSSYHIGVGTDEPAQALDVAGNTRIRGQFILDDGVLLGAVQSCTGNTTTLSTLAGPVRYLETTNATGVGGIHEITVPDGSNTGQTLKIIFTDTPANGTSIEFSTTNFLGVSSLGLPGSGFVGGGAQGGCLDLIWTGSKWIIVSVNHKVSAS